ncbi:glycosyltransferase [Clostridium sp. MCC353]|uniref:glycosyltransferase family 4 protein n=1 Tax=Clostridium sp. MCC353 TaxID=2592646 RepID=UPI001C01B5C3|nr:glycosyltransferase family 4 protein [Clostridium sp. MCC353]MBT9779479.1 glycosyltransferase [Clostridium sp. MCC353]
MKVLHINRNYITSPLHQVMMKHFDQCEDLWNTVFSPTDLEGQASYTPLSKTKVCVNRCFNKRDRFIFDFKQYKIITALEKKIDVGHFDCIHAYTLFTDGNCAMKLSEKYGLPYIVVVRNTDVNDFFKKLPFLRRRGIRIMETADAICFLSESYREKVFNLYVPDRLKKRLLDKSYIIPNGIDDFWLKNIYSERHKLHRPLRLIYAGRIDGNKNIETTIEALKELRDMGVEAEMDVIGEIYDKKVYRRIQHHECVHYHKAVPKETLIEFYRNSDLFIMPSFTESFGLVYAEAMSQGLPVIYTQGEGFDNQFPEGKAGYHVDPKDSRNIALAIKKIIDRYQEISESVIECAQKFNWGDITKQYIEIYRKIC